MTHTQSEALIVVTNYFNAWSNKNFDEAASYLSDSIVIETPINHYPTKESFMQAVQFTAMGVSSINQLASFGKDSDAMLLYDMVLNPLGTIRVAEYFKVTDGKIVQISQIHDTYELRKAGFDKSA